MKIINTNKFKATYITVNFITKLKKEEVTKNIVWAKTILKATNSGLKSLDIERKFASLYSSSYGVGVEKLGDLFSIQFRVDFLNSKFLPNNYNVLEENLKLLSEIIYNPLVVNGAFDKDIVEKQKEIIKDIINSKKDDKKLYAISKCEELLNENPEDVYVYGRIEDLKNIDEKNAYEQYQKVLKEADVEVVVTGNVTDNIEGIIRKYIKGITGIRKEVKIITNNDKDVKVEIEEDSNMSQAILMQGYKILNFRKEDLNKYIVLNTILGGGSTSKLFQNVRERASLAYYTYSRINRYTGKMFVCTGINPKNYSKTIELVNRQIDEIKEGKITDEEFNTAISLIENNYTELEDIQTALDSVYLNNKLYNGSDTTVKKIINEIKKVNKSDIIKLVNNIIPKVVYMLGGNENV